MPIAHPRSLLRYLTVRLALIAASCVTLGLVLVWLLVTTIVARDAEHAFEARLTSLVDALAVAVTIRDGHPVLIRAVSEPRFERPLSGMYFQIQAPSGELLTSRSLWDERLPPGVFGHTEVLLSDVAGPLGQRLRMVERDIVVPGTTRVTHILVAGALNETVEQIASTKRVLSGAFLFLGTALVVTITTLVAASLGGLRRVHQLVSYLRAGGHTRDGLPIPAEVGPLVNEIELLVAQNRETVDRARNHVGNLAHALRTRLAVIRNAVDLDDKDVLRQELAEAERLVQHHLARARAASLSGTTAQSIPALAMANDLVHVLHHLNEERGLTVVVEGDADALVRCDRDDFAEILGNLIENACKWARSGVEVAIRERDENVVVTISDDGPGLTREQTEMALRRGVRLDESVPGSGLGLGIASELASLYQGSIDLVSPGALGGLTAIVAIPAGRH